MPAPTTPKVEVEFTAGVWTDVTADAESGWSIRVGRTSPQQSTQPSTLTITLANVDGRYTPGAAVLSDSVTAAPYYPNVTRRKRIRCSTSAGQRFFGYIKSWTPTRRDGVAGYTLIQASDRLDNLARVKLPDSIAGAVLNDGPIAYYPLTEPAGSSYAVDQSGHGRASLLSNNGTNVTFGNPGVSDGSGGTAVTFINSGGALTATFNPGLTLGGLTVEFWINWGVNSAQVLALIDNNGTVRSMAANGGTGGLTWSGTDGLFVPGNFGYNDNTWHHVVLTMPAPGTAGGAIYMDTVIESGSVTAGSSPFGSQTALIVGSAGFLGSIAHVAVYDYALSNAQIANHFESGLQAGELVSDKIIRWLTVAGLTTSVWDITPSKVVTGSYPQQAKSVADACQDLTTNTEGGGALFWVNPSTGLVTFRPRTYSKPASPTMTLDADKDLSDASWQPTNDDTQLLNQVTVTRATASGGQSAQIVKNPTSIAAEGLVWSTVSSYTNTDQDALNLGQWLVSVGSTPGVRLAQITVDLITGETAGLYTALQSTLIGSRIRITNVPVGALPATQWDLIVQGWTETYTVDTYTVAFDTTPADAPAQGVWDFFTGTFLKYSRWQAQPDCALHTTITAASTTIVIDSPTAPTFTTAAGMYSPGPITIQIDAEVISLTAPPGGSTSPQTFTGCLRGQQGTTPAAHSAGAQVQLWPAVTWTL